MTTEQKAAAWDALEKKVGECYEVDENGDLLNEDFDLTYIGELCVNAFGLG